jgi:hypothetical protein
VSREDYAMIRELGSADCGMLGHNSGPALIAYLNHTAYSRQLKTLIEIADAFSDLLKIYVARDIALKALAGAVDIKGTPTYLLIDNDLEQGRLLGEADAKRLAEFIRNNLKSPAAQAAGAPRAV